jgi:sirohydrochlorin ferrochelatase
MARNSRHKSHLILVEAIAQGQSVAQASRMAGVSVRTSFRRLAEPSFQQAVSDCRATMFEQVTGMLAATTKKAASDPLPISVPVSVRESVLV